WTQRDRIAVVPNGVDHRTMSPGKPAPGTDCPDVVFVAASNYFPNEDAALFFAHDVWPRVKREFPAYRFGIIGGRPSAALRALNSSDIVVRGPVDEVLSYYRGCSLAVVPLRSGSGTRLKILEAAAMGVPMVSTTLGAEGLDFVHRKH